MTPKERYEAWVSCPALTPEDRALLQSITDQDRIAALFRKDLGFGTGGIRGIIGPGSANINRYVVRRATAGFALLLLERFGEAAKSRGIAVAWDSRHFSKEIAEETALTLAAYGIRAFLFDEVSATPLLSFAVRRLHCAGGVVITASHNAKEYNGYKAYDETGCQLSLEASKELMAKASALRLEEIPVLSKEEALRCGLLQFMPEEVFEAYVGAVESFASASLSKDAKKAVSIVYTPLHGAGSKPVRRVLSDLGYANVHTVKEQELPDGSFPTVRYPNPEIPDALTLALQLAEEKNADVVIATDPDSDRMGLCAKDQDEKHVVFTGNQIGVLLLNYLLETTDLSALKDPTLVTTVVTGRMGPAIAEANGLSVRMTLIGFKHICGAMNRLQEENKDLFFGYEESFGYLPGDHTRDKDGVLSALKAVEMAAYYKAKGKTLPQVLQELYQQYGYYLDMSTYYLYGDAAGRAKIEAIAEELRRLGTGLMEGIVKAEDYSKGLDGLPPENMMKFYFEDGSWIAARPSGTEPKIKIYYSIKGSSPEYCSRLFQLRKAAIDNLVRNI